ncbi:MAG: hypothetical protein QG599_2732, partial [Pseudomonadota bacterium]|nr:hypothetical protein [Pseudomonadota bacterium]
AAGLGVSLVGMNAARADAILFPYFAVSDTVTSLVTTINMAGQAGASTVNPQELHYRLYYKTGGNVDSLDALCEEFDIHRVTSPNDIVTFDLQAHYGADTLAVVGEPVNRQLKANYTAASQNFGLMRGITPSRGFLIVDNQETPNVEFEGSLTGEMMLVDFAEGAVWGYLAYNAERQNANFLVDASSFQDAAESAGEVIAGDRIVQQVVFATDAAAALGSGAVPVRVEKFANGRAPSPPVPTGIMPIASATTNGSVFTKFFVTPIGHAVDTIHKVAVGGQVRDPAAGRTVRATTANPGQIQESLTTRIELTVRDRTGIANDVVFDRDENPVSGQVPRNVTCVGAVPVESLLSTGALREIGEYGGWSTVQIRAATAGGVPALVTFGADGPAGTPTAGIATATRTINTGNGNRTNTEEAVVIKLEYNPSGAFLDEQFPSAFNTANWLRRGHRESIRGSIVGGLVQDRLTQQSAYDVNGAPVGVADDFTGGTSIPIQSTFQ